MCGRFTLINKEKVRSKIGVEIDPNYNIRPSHKILILTPKPVWMTWGFSPVWAEKRMNLINARFETLYEKPSFRNVERCLIVADGWYEWKKTDVPKSDPFYIHNEGMLLYIAGIFNEIGCAIITTKAMGNLGNIHHRQPLLLTKENRHSWIVSGIISNQDSVKNFKCQKVGTFVNYAETNDNRCVSEIIT